MNPSTLSASRLKQTTAVASIFTYFDSPDSPRSQLSIAPSRVSNERPQRVSVSPVCGFTTYSDGYIETPILALICHRASAPKRTDMKCLPFAKALMAGSSRSAETKMAQNSSCRGCSCANLLRVGENRLHGGLQRSGEAVVSQESLRRPTMSRGASAPPSCPKVQQDHLF